MHLLDEDVGRPERAIIVVQSPITRFSHSPIRPGERGEQEECREAKLLATSNIINNNPSLVIIAPLPDSSFLPTDSDNPSWFLRPVHHTEACEKRHRSRSAEFRRVTIIFVFGCNIFTF